MTVLTNFLDAYAGLFRSVSPWEQCLLLIGSYFVLMLIIELLMTMFFRPTGSLLFGSGNSKSTSNRTGKKRLSAKSKKEERVINPTNQHWEERIPVAESPSSTEKTEIIHNPSALSSSISSPSSSQASSAEKQSRQAEKNKLT